TLDGTVGCYGKIRIGARPDLRESSRRANCGRRLSRPAAALWSAAFHGKTAMARSIIIDTDPGQDDAIAILLALASAELEVLGITAVAGNVPLALTSANVRRVCELAGRTDVKVAAGADRPLLRSLVTAEHVHGKTGLNGADLPEPTMPLDRRHAAQFIINSVMQRPENSVTLCTLGPLTNVAQ